MPNPEYRAFGGTDRSQAAGGGANSNWTGLLQDPGFLSMMAGMGAQIDPEGAGGAIGGPTQQWIQQQQTGKAMEKQGQVFDKLLEALAGGKVSKLKVGRDGEVSMEGAKEGSSLQKEGEMNLATPMEASTPFNTWAENAQKRLDAFGARWQR